MSRKFVLSALVASALSLLAATANATPILRLTSSAGGSVTIADGGVGDSSAMTGVVVFNGSITGWFVNVTTGLSKPVLGSAERPLMDLASVNVSGGAGSLTIELTDTDFIGTPEVRTAVASVGGTTSGGVTFDTYWDAGNASFSQASALTSVAHAPVAFSGSETQRFTPGAGLYSLTEVVTITHTGMGVTSFDAELRVVPEPPIAALIGAGLLCTVFARRRKPRVA